MPARTLRSELPDFLRPSSLGIIIFVERIIYLPCIYLMCAFSLPVDTGVSIGGLSVSLPTVFSCLNGLWALFIMIEAISFLRAGQPVLSLLVYSGLPLGVLITLQVALYYMERAV